MHLSSTQSACALLLVPYCRRGGSLTRAAFLSARNDALANIAIITAGLVTAFVWRTAWPDLIVGLAIGAINLDAAREVWRTARDEHHAEPRSSNEMMSAAKVRFLALSAHSWDRSSRPAPGRFRPIPAGLPRADRRGARRKPVLSAERASSRTRFWGEASLPLSKLSATQTLRHSLRTRKDLLAR